MAQIKRTYQKKKIDGKITVKHFANERLLPFLGKEILHERLQLNILNFDYQYPLYIKINVKNQQTTIKSTLNIYASISELEKPSPELKSKLLEDIKLVEDIVTSLKPFERESFSVKEVKALYESNSIELNKLVEKTLFRFLNDSIKRISSNTTLIKDSKYLIPVESALKQLYKELSGNNVDFFTLLPNIKSLKQFDNEIALYSETIYSFQYIYNFLLFKTGNKYFIKDFFNHKFTNDLSLILDSSSIKNVESDLQTIMNQFRLT